MKNFTTITELELLRSAYHTIATKHYSEQRRIREDNGANALPLAHALVEKTGVQMKELDNRIKELEQEMVALSKERCKK